MAFPIFHTVVGVIVAGLLHHYIRLALQHHRLSLLSAQHGCALPSTQHSRWPGGLGRLIRIMRIRGDVLENWLGADFRHHGVWTFAATAPLRSTPSLFTADPTNVQAILAKNFADWGLGPAREKKFGPFLGVGVFTADGEVWSRSRAIVRPAFQRKQVSDLRETDVHVSRLMRCLGSDANSDGWTSVTDIMPFIFRFTMDNATQFLFGESVESQQQGDNHQTQAFEEAFHNATTGVGLKMFIGPFFWVVDCSMSFRRACRLCREYAVRFVDAALAVRKQGKMNGAAESGTEKGVFLRTLIEATQDRTALRDQLMQLLFAGRDTTATLLSWSLLCLAHTPGAWQRLREEVQGKFGLEDEASQLVSYESLKECAYLQNVLRETLRLFPPIGVNGKQALRDTVLPTGGGPDGSQPIAVARGTPVLFTTYIMHRRPDIWGHDAAEWNPDRWAGRRPGWSYIPFNGGPRHCPGEQFALTQAAYTLLRMAQTFDSIDCPDRDNAFEKGIGLIIQPKKVMMRFHRADQA